MAALLTCPAYSRRLRSWTSVLTAFVVVPPVGFLQVGQGLSEQHNRAEFEAWSFIPDKSKIYVKKATSQFGVTENVDNLPFGEGMHR